MTTPYACFTWFLFLLFMGVEASIIEKVESNYINDIASSPESLSNSEADPLLPSVSQILSLRTSIHHRHERIAENTSPSIESTHSGLSGQKLWNSNENLPSNEEVKQDDESKGNSRMRKILKMNERRKHLKNAKVTRALIANMKQNPEQMRKLMRSRRIKAKVMELFNDSKHMHEMLNLDLKEVIPFMTEMMSVINTRTE
ncbi:hypothetical protein WDU94_014724 [Cyamophila willieti]